jgi:O-antigen ligase
MLALILGNALAVRNLPAVLGWMSFAVLAAVPLLFTLSRSSWVAAIPMLLTLILLSPRRLVLMGTLGVAVILGPMLFPKQVVDRYNYTLHAKEDRGDYRIGDARLDTSTSARLDSWRAGITGWSQRPFFGYGVTGFAFMDAQFIRVLVETGLIGLATFLWLLWRIFRTAWASHRHASGTGFEGLTMGYLAGLVAMVAHGIGANTFIIVRIMEPFWFLTGVITMLPSLEEQGKVAAAAPEPRQSRGGNSAGRHAVNARGSRR